MLTVDCLTPINLDVFLTLTSKGFFLVAHHCSEIHQTSTCRGNESNSAGECSFPRVESRNLTSKPSHLAELVDQIHESRSLNVTAWHPVAISHHCDRCFPTRKPSFTGQVQQFVISVVPRQFGSWLSWGKLGKAGKTQRESPVDMPFDTYQWIRPPIPYLTSFTVIHDSYNYIITYYAFA